MSRYWELIKQIFRFGIVGGICFIIDFLLMIFLTDFLYINYIISCGISFSISTIINYILSLKLVFKNTSNMSKKREFVIFVVMSIIGLGLTEILMFACVEYLCVYYIYSKIIVTLIVMSYNFITRKYIFEIKG